MLKQTREIMGITLQSMADALGVSRQAVHNLETSNKATLERLYLMCHYYGLTLDDLIARKKDLLVEAGQRCIDRGNADMARTWFALAKEINNNK